MSEMTLIHKPTILDTALKLLTELPITDCFQELFSHQLKLQVKLFTTMK